MNAKILIIEDDRDLLEDIKTLLIEEGYQAYSATNGDDGIKIAKKEIPDLIICDIMMSGIDGYSVLKKLRRNETTFPIPFIFLTAKVERESYRFGMQLGADDYLYKPFLSEDLLKSIQVRIQKAKRLKKENESFNKVDIQQYPLEDRIFIKVKGQSYMIKIEDIAFIEANNQYTSLHLINGKSYLIRKPISGWTDILKDKFFMRIHRSTIINLELIEKMEKWKNSSLIIHLKNINKSFIVSKKNSAKLRKHIFK